MKLRMKIIAASAMLVVAGASFAQKGETVKMVRIDPLSGLMGPVGVSQFKGYQFLPKNSAARATRPA